MADAKTSVRYRVLVGKPGLDGHDRGAKVIAHALRDAGFEVIYTGLRSSIEQIASATEQEAVDVIGLSVLSGAHLSIAERLRALLDERKLAVPIVMGGIIPEADHPALKQLGVAAIYGPDTPLDKIVTEVRTLAETARSKE